MITLNLMVTPLPIAQIMGVDTAYCDTASVVTLMGMPAGGTFSGDGMSGNQFDPSNALLGINTIQYIYVDNNSCADTATITTTVQACNFIGVQAIPSTNFLIYPNPSTGIVFLEQDQARAVLIEVFRENGQLVLQKTTNNTHFQLSLQEQINGIYFIRMTSATASTYQKLLLIK